jgi:hypothetical protein
VTAVVHTTSRAPGMRTVGSSSVIRACRSLRRLGAEGARDRDGGAQGEPGDQWDCAWEVCRRWARTIMAVGDDRFQHCEVGADAGTRSGGKRQVGVAVAGVIVLGANRSGSKLAGWS